jgi:hypothetical protein
VALSGLGSLLVMEHTMAQRLAELHARKAEALTAGGDEAIARHR